MDVYPAEGETVNDRRCLWMLSVLCLAALMLGINGTIVNVALPTVGLDLHFSDASLVWVVNAYLTNFGGFFPLGGGLSDLYGRRRLLLSGMVIFTLASLGCGLANSSAWLVAARAAQGLGGAIISATVLSGIVNLFSQASKRTKALGVYVFSSFGGGCIGLLLGGILTSMLSWRWVFLINVPIGAGLYALCAALLPRDRKMPCVDVWT